MPREKPGTKYRDIESNSPPKTTGEKSPLAKDVAKPSTTTPLTKQPSSAQLSASRNQKPTQKTGNEPIAPAAETPVGDDKSTKAKGDNVQEGEEPEDDLMHPLGIFGPQFQQRETEDLCFSMGMTMKEVQRLIDIFNDIDANCTLDQSGTRCVVVFDFTSLFLQREFYFLLDTPQNTYTSAILRFAAHKSDPVKLDIDDFVRIICSFVLMPQTDVIRFCFETFDEDDSGSLSKDEFIHMCESIQIRGEGFFKGNFKKAMEAFDTNHDGLLDLNEFMAINHQFPLVFWPLFHFQQTMQAKTLGSKLWTAIHHRQLKIDAWRRYMQKYLGRAPPLSWQERWCGCILADQRLRLIAAQLYDQDMLRLKLQANRAAAENLPQYKRTEADRKKLNKMAQSSSKNLQTTQRNVQKSSR